MLSSGLATHWFLLVCVGLGLKLIRFGAFAAEKPGLILSDGTRADASAFGRGLRPGIFCQWRPRPARTVVQERCSARSPSAFIRALGFSNLPAKQDYLHRAELSRSRRGKQDGTPPKTPSFFSSQPPLWSGRPVRIPRNATKLDWEVELAVVIGRKAA